MPLILASTSVYRRELLDRLGVPYQALPHRVDERAEAPVGRSPDEIALHLAFAKARSLADGSAHVLASDQLVDLDGTVLGKPGSEAAAIEQLRHMSGRTPRLLTAVALAHPDGRVETTLDLCRLTMRPLEDEEILRYVQADQPLDCAGSYKIERLGIALFSRIEGEDFTAITGLPLITVARLLRQAGYRTP